MALAPFSVLCGGKLRSDAEEEKRKESGEKGRLMPWQTQWERTPEEKKVCDALEKVRAEVSAKSLTSGTSLQSYATPLSGLTPSVVAIAYVMHKAPFVFPIIGGRKPEQIVANIEALDIALSDDQIAFLDTAKPLDLGFPNYMIVSIQTVQS
jgi:aryl-alcohol dehydrogenase-like predicted oxidoreductase